MPFRSIVGHRHVVDLLVRAVARDWLPPSLILSGPEGVGKRRVALALAQALNCTRLSEVRSSKSESRGSDPRKPGPPDTGHRTPDIGHRTSDTGHRTPDSYDACGECAACRRIEKGTYPDVLLVDEEGVHPEILDVEVKENSAIIPVEVLREVIKAAQFRPYEGRRRVIIIDPADAMTAFGQNALLKVLEETPPATVFVLVTSRPDVLYATIRSRCPQIRFGPLTAADIARVLTRDHGLGEREARAAAIIAGGSVARALEAASEETTDARSQALVLLQQAASSREPRRLLDAMKAVFGMEKRPGPAPAVEREHVSLSLRALTSLLRDVLMIGAGGPASDLANADLREDLEHVAAALGRAHVMRAFAAVDRALAALGGNVNPKLVVDWLAFQM
jgi:DNA polymerase-3 subunit delta'